MSTIGVISLGCCKNQVDTERMMGLLRAAGHTFVQRPEEAEVLIVNTCGFIEPAKQESINTILEMAEYKKHGRCKTLVATGCLTKRYMAELNDSGAMLRNAVRWETEDYAADGYPILDYAILRFELLDEDEPEELRND